MKHSSTSDLGERVSRLGRQINYRVRLRSVEDLGMLVEAGVGIAILSEVFAAVLCRSSVSILPLSEPWASRNVHLCASSVLRN